IGRVRVMQRFSDGQEPEEQHDLSATVTEIVDTGINCLWVGVDINDMNDPEVRARFEATPYPSELLDRTKVANRRMLRETELPESMLRFRQMDFTDPKKVDELIRELEAIEAEQDPSTPKRRYVHLITSAYEAPDMLEAAKKIAGPNGIVFVQDHV